MPHAPQPSASVSVASAAGAIEDAARAISATGNMGLKGVLASVANLTAVALICVLFVFNQRDAVQQAREDRLMFREVTAAQWSAIQKNQTTLIELTKAVEELAIEVREMARDRKREK